MSENPDPVDIHVGSRVKLRRNLTGLSQTDLGDAVGLTFQQIQKYEKGHNRIGASRLFQFSKILDIPVSFFFDDMPENIEVLQGKIQYDKQNPDDPLAKRETLELVRHYYSLPEEIRNSFFTSIKEQSKFFSKNPVSTG